MAQAAVQIVWFKRDLRVADHAALAGAAAAGPVLPLFIVEPELWRQPDMSARQWTFVAESLADLRHALAALGQPLVVRVGPAVAVLERARRRFGATALWSHQETGSLWTYARDRAVAAWARQQGLSWHEPRQCGVTRRLRSRSGWARSWDAFLAGPAAPQPLALPPLGDVEPGEIPTARDLGLPDDPCPGRQPGGRGAGLDLLASFLDHRAGPYRRAMSSPLSGARHCSRLSPHLAWGTVSMREATQAAADRRSALAEAGGAAGFRAAIAAFEARLHWRGHFMQKLEDEPEIEIRNFHRACDGLRPAEPDAARLAAWQAGETGLPFVDACMRMLMETGWMNFRMRAMLTAVAAHHLWLDWRRPGEHLARLFTDYEPGIHWSQMQMQSGTTGINTVRIYNPVKQGRDQDPDGRLIRRFLPELADVPDAFLHEPWLWPEAGRLLGRRYPFPVVDHLAAAREARQKVWGLRKAAGFADEARAIQERHGSRKSGLPPTGSAARRRRPGAGPAEAGQMMLPLDGAPARAPRSSVPE